MDQFNRLIELAEDLTALLPHRSKPGVAVMGAFNAGKSTLVNGLLGEEISPVGVTPTTSCLMVFEHGDNYDAGYTAKIGNFTVKDINQLHTLLKKGLTTSRDMAVLHYPSPFLKTCRLIDTPGLDSWQDAGDLIELAALEADYVIYLFHQRGIEDLNRLFLYRLAEIWKKRDIKKLTFLLNCNQGMFDGSSLETTRKLLREIFLYPVRCQSINTHSPDDIEALKQFIQLQLALDTCRGAAGHLKKLDQTLPQRLKKAAGIKDDPTFLSEYWHIQNTARIILETGRLLHSLPMVSGQPLLFFPDSSGNPIPGPAPVPEALFCRG
jgi:GTPase SAR1 family protein